MWPLEVLCYFSFLRGQVVSVFSIMGMSTVLVGWPLEICWSLCVPSAKKKVLITKIENDKGESMTSRKGIADVFGEFYKTVYEDNEEDDSEHKVDDDGNYSNTDVHNDTEETAGIPKIKTEELQTVVNKLNKGKSPATKEFEPKTFMIVMRIR